MDEINVSIQKTEINVENVSQNIDVSIEKKEINVERISNQVNVEIQETQPISVEIVRKVIEVSI